MNLPQQVNISVMKMAMDTAKVQMADMIEILDVDTKTMEQSVNPHLVRSIDISL